MTSPANAKSLFLRLKKISPVLLSLAIHLAHRFGSAARAGSSLKGETSIGAPVTFNCSIRGACLEEISRHTALPTPNHPRSEKFAALLRSEDIAVTVLCDGVLRQEIVELRDRLEEVTESQETAVGCPGGSNRLSDVSCMPSEEDAGVDGLGARWNHFVETCDEWVGDSIQESEARLVG